MWNKNHLKNLLDLTYDRKFTHFLFINGTFKLFLLFEMRQVNMII